MPRPRVDPSGRIVPESELRDLFVIYSEAGSGLFQHGYLTKLGVWEPELSIAAAWPEKETAETVAALIIVGNPGRYFGKVRVVGIKG